MIQERITFISGMEEENLEPSLHFSHGQDARQGQIGGGQVGVTSYVVPKGAMEFWEKRLEKFNVSFYKKGTLWGRIFRI